MRKFRVLLAVLVVMLLSVGIVACDGEPPAPIVANEIQLNVTAKTLLEGETFQLEATVLPEDAVNKTVVWSTDSETVATVSDSGLVTAVHEGTAIITATVGTVTKTATITVQPIIDVDSVTLSRATATSIEVGSKFKLEASVLPANATDKTLTWSSDKESIATVANGVVTAVAVGTAKITATADGKSATVDFTVVAKGTPIAISAPADIDLVRSNLSGSFYMTKDIDFGDAKIYPIGDQELWNHATQNSTNGDTARDVPNGFRGIFDGRGYALKNFAIIGNPPNAENSCYNNALFPGLYGGTIRNLAITGVTQDLGTADDLSRASLLVNSFYGGTIENVYIQGTIQAPVRGDNWRYGGTIFGGSGDTSDPLTNKFMKINNVITNVTVSGTANLNRIYPIAGRIQNMATASTTSITNIFVVNDGLTQTALSNAGADLVSSCTLFKLADVGKTDFKVLPASVWNVTADALPTLKPQGAPQGETLAVTGYNLVGEGFTLVADATAQRYSEYKFAVEVADGYRTTDDFAVEISVNGGTATLIEPVSNTGDVYTFSAGYIASESSLEIKGVEGIVRCYDVAITAPRGVTFVGAATVDAGQDYVFSFNIKKGFVFDAGDAVAATGEEGEDGYVPAVEAWDNFRFGYKLGGAETVTWVQEGVTDSYCTIEHDHVEDACEEDCAILHDHNDECALTATYGFTIPKALITANFEVIVEGIVLDGARYAVDLSVGNKMDNAIAISTAEEFLKINDDLTADYYLVNDIDFGGATINALAFKAGGGDAIPFSGTLDGRGYAVKNYKITNSVKADGGLDVWGVALFTELTGTIRNLQLLNFEVTGWGQIGSFAGGLNGVIENCYAEGRITSTNTGWSDWPGAISGTLVGCIGGAEGTALKNNVTNVKTSGAVLVFAGAFYGSAPITFENNFALGDGIAAGSKYANNRGDFTCASDEATALSKPETGFCFASTKAGAGENGLYLGNIDFSVLPSEFWDGNVASGAGMLPTLKTNSPYPFVSWAKGMTADPEATGDLVSTETFPMQDYIIIMKLKDGWSVPSGKNLSLTLSMDQGAAAKPVEFTLTGERLYNKAYGEHWKFVIDVNKVDENDKEIAGKTIEAITGTLSIPVPRAAVPAVEDDPDTTDVDETAAAIPAFTAITNVVKNHVISGLGAGEGYTVAADENTVADGGNFYFTVEVEAGKVPVATYKVGTDETAVEAEFESSSEDGTLYTFSISKITDDVRIEVALADQSAFEALEGGEDAGWFNSYRQAYKLVYADDVADIGDVEGDVTYAGELLSGNGNLASSTDGVAVSGSGIIEFRFWFLVDGVRTFYVDVTIEALDLPGVTAEWTPISTPEEFDAMRYNENGKYYLTNDIVFTGTDAERTIMALFPSSKNNNTPTTGFKGIFDGRGYTIQDVRVRNRDVSSDKDHNVALFGQISPSGVVKNVNVVGFDIDTWMRGGTIATYIYGTVENVYLEGKFTSRFNNTSNIANDSWDRSGAIATGVRAGGVLKNVVAKIDTKSGGSAQGVYAVTTVQNPQSAPNSTVAAKIENVFVVSDDIKAWTNSNISLTTKVEDGTYTWGIDQNADGKRTLQDAKVFKIADVATINFAGLPEASWNRNAAAGMTALPTLKTLAAPAAVDSETYYASIDVKKGADVITALNLKVATSETLTATGVAATTPSVTDIMWATADSSIATVTAAGVVTGQDAGTTTIYAYNAVTVTKITVTVTSDIEAPNGWIPVSTAVQFGYINNNLQGNYYLTNDIDFAGFDFISIGLIDGNTSQQFGGVFDGRGYSLKNITIKSVRNTSGTTTWGMGVFANVSATGVIKNVNVINIDVASNQTSDNNLRASGTIAGWLNGGTLENIYIQGKITTQGTTGWVDNRNGLIVGRANAGSVVTNVVANVTSNSTASLHSIFGRTQLGTYTNIYVNGQGIPGGNPTGGSGNNDAAADETLGFTNVVVWGNSVGGKITHTLATVDFTALGAAWTGAVASGVTAETFPTVTVVTAAPVAIVDAASVTLLEGAGFVMDGDASVVFEDDYTFTVTVAEFHKVTEAGVTVDYTLGGEAQTALVGVEDDETDGLFSFTIEEVTGDIVITAVNGIEIDWVEIGTKADFLEKLTPETKNGFYRLTADIDFGNEVIPTIAKNGAADCFVGTFDGQGFTLKNFKTNPDSDYDASLFAGLGHGGVIRNLNVLGADIKDTANRSGILVGTMRGGTIENIYAEGTVGQNALNGTDRASLLVGGCYGRITDANGGPIVLRNIVVNPTDLRGIMKTTPANIPDSNGMSIIINGSGKETNSTVGDWQNNPDKSFLVVENFFAVLDIFGEYGPGLSTIKGSNTGRSATKVYLEGDNANVDKVNFSTLPMSNWNFDTESGLPMVCAEKEVVKVRVDIDDGSGELDRYSAITYTLLAGGTIGVEDFYDAIDAKITATKLSGYANTLEYALSGNNYSLQVQDGEDYKAFTDSMLSEIDQDLSIVVRLNIFA